MCGRDASTQSIFHDIVVSSNGVKYVIHLRTDVNYHLKTSLLHRLFELSVRASSADVVTQEHTVNNNQCPLEEVFQ